MALSRGKRATLDWVPDEDWVLDESPVQDSASGLLVEDPQDELLVDVTAPIAGPLSIYIDSNKYTAQEKGELLSLISELYELQTSDKLVIDEAGTAEPVVATVPEPQGGPA